MPALSLRSVLRDVAGPFSQALGLTKLPEHFDGLVLSACFFWSVQVVWGPFLSRTLCRNSYARLPSGRTRNNWNVHVVSLVHSLIIIPLAFRCLKVDVLEGDRAYAWDSSVGTVLSISCGYFAWDTLESVIHYSDAGFVAHGLACFVIYLLTFQPFIAYYGPRFLLWELSTPFLNIHWFMDKMSMTGSKLQMANGAVLLATFAGVRLIYGSIMSYAFYQTLFEVRGEINAFVFATYCIGNTVLNALNWFWFTKMIAALRKRTKPIARPSDGMTSTKTE